jgi:hypothetical protein
MGAQPGSAPGIATADPASLGPGVQSWPGTEDPDLRPHYDEEQGVPVLVVTVAPPESGQRIHPPQGPGSHDSGRRLQGIPAGTVFARHPGRTEIAGPGGIRPSEDRYPAPALESARAAEANTRRLPEIRRERHAAEELDRRRARLMETSGLVTGAQLQATPARDSRDHFRCPEHPKLQTVLAGMDYAQIQAEMPEAPRLAGAGQGLETFGAAVTARREIGAAMRKLTVERGSE